MQEEVDQKTIALAVKTGKLTAQVLQAAIRKYLAARQKGTGKHRECSHTPGKIPDPAHLPGRGFSLWGSPKPLVSSKFTIHLFQDTPCHSIIKPTIISV